MEPSDEYFIEFLQFGYRYPTFRNIKIRKNEVTNIDFTVDFTDQTGIKGVIKINGEIIEIGNVTMTFLNNGNSYSMWSCLSGIDENGEYSCLGLQPGMYRMEILLYYSENKRITKELIVEIKKDQMKTMNFNFNEEK